MILDPKKLRNLIQEYRKLQGLEGYNAQTRGQRLNGFLAELLRCWGINAAHNIRGSGEIDVGFELGGRHFIVEAKWESEPIGTGPIAKLQKRIRQRLSGTIGLFISMSGYSPEAVSEVKEGERPSVLLLTQEHLEAMLSGFVPPEELIERLLTKASLSGEVGPTLNRLFDEPRVEEIGIDFSHPPEVNPLVAEAIPGFRAQTVVSSLPFGQSGIAEICPGQVLVTLSEGLFALDFKAHKVKPRVLITDCSRNALVGSDETIFFIRRAGVGCIRNGQLYVVGGGFCGNISLFQDNGKGIWIFANGYMGVNSHPIVARLGETLGDETLFEIEYPSACGSNATLIEEDRILIIGSAGIAVADLKSGKTKIITNNFVNPMGLVRYSDTHFIIASGNVELSELNVETFSHKPLARFNLSGSISELAKSSEGGGYLFTHYTNGEGLSKGILVRWWC